MKFLILVSFLCVSFCRAAIIQLADAEQATFSNAVAAASSGDIIRFPSGTTDTTWTNTVTIPSSKSLVIVGSLDGTTYIRDGITNTIHNLINWTVGSGFNRIRNITFLPSRVTTDFTGLILMLGTGKLFRVDHCFFSNVANHCVYPRGAVYGVADHNTFLGDSSGGNNRPIHLDNGNNDGAVWGDYTWEQVIQWGSSNAFFFEDNNVRLFSTLGLCDAEAGAMFTMRFNSITNARIATHGTESGGRFRGYRAYEVYGNTLTNATGSAEVFDSRGGNFILASNVFLGAYGSTMTLDNYRNFVSTVPWLSADGTADWDDPDLSDGGGTPGGAGDGVFEGGQATSSGALSMADGTKSWTVNEWDGYTLRSVATNTATSGGVRSATVSGAGWTVNEWLNYIFTKTSDNSKGYVSANTSDTITLSASACAVDMTGGGEFVLSRHTEILSNTSTNLTLLGQGGVQPNYTFPAGTYYEIRRLNWALDQPGRGTTLAGLIDGVAQPCHQSLSQTNVEMCFAWENTLNGSAHPISAGNSSVIEGRDFTNAVKSGWTPFTYPHPLTATNAAVPTSATLATSATLDFDSTGGFAPYIFTIASGGGSIDASTGVYTAPAAPESNVIVRIWDSFGNYADAEVDVFMVAVTSQPGGFNPLFLP